MKIYKIMIYGLFTLLLFISCSYKSTSTVNPENNFKTYTIAILPVKNKINGNYSNLVRDYLEIEFTSYPEYQVIDRANIDKLLKEQSLSQIGLTKDSSAEIGKFLKADLVIVTDLYIDNDIWILSGKIIDTSTSKVIIASTGKASSSKYLNGAAKGLARRLTHRMI